MRSVIITYLYLICFILISVQTFSQVTRTYRSGNIKEEKKKHSITTPEGNSLKYSERRMYYEKGALYRQIINDVKYNVRKWYDDGQLSEFRSDDIVITWFPNGVIRSILLTPYGRASIMFYQTGRTYKLKDTDSATIIWLPDGTMLSALKNYHNTHIPIPIDTGFYNNFNPEKNHDYSDVKTFFCQETLDGNLIIRYPNNQVLANISFYKNLRNGKWELFYPNGNPFRIINYKYGKKYGKYTYYYQDGKINKEGTYKNDMNIGIRKRYLSNGNPKDEYLFNKKFPYGTVKSEWFENGSMRISRSYDQKGKSHGKWYTGSRAGDTIRSSYVVHGKTHWSRLYYEGGKLKEEVIYDTLNTSKWIQKTGYLKNGNIEYTKEYISSDSYIYSTYYKSGKLHKKGKCINHLREGEFTRYDEKGKIIDILEYKNGVLHFKPYKLECECSAENPVKIMYPTRIDRDLSYQKFKMQFFDYISIIDSNVFTSLFYYRTTGPYRNNSFGLISFDSLLVKISDDNGFHIMLNPWYKGVGEYSINVTLFNDRMGYNRDHILELIKFEPGHIAIVFDNAFLRQVDKNSRQVVRVKGQIIATSALFKVNSILFARYDGIQVDKPSFQCLSYSRIENSDVYLSISNIESRINPLRKYDITKGSDKVWNTIIDNNPDLERYRSWSGLIATEGQLDIASSNKLVSGSIVRFFMNANSILGQINFSDLNKKKYRLAIKDLKKQGFKILHSQNKSVYFFIGK